MPSDASAPPGRTLLLSPTLLDGGAPTEHRAANPNVCRAGPDRGLEILAHPGGDPGGCGADPAYPLGQGAQSFECGNRVLPQRRTPHHTPQPGAAANPSDRAPMSAGAAPPRPGDPAGSSSRLTWTRQSMLVPRTEAPWSRPLISLTRPPTRPRRRRPRQRLTCC